MYEGQENGNGGGGGARNFPNQMILCSSVYNANENPANNNTAATTESTATDFALPISSVDFSYNGDKNQINNNQVKWKITR